MSINIYGKRVNIIYDGEDTVDYCNKCCFNDNQHCNRPDHPLCLDKDGEANYHFEEVKVK